MHETKPFEILPAFPFDEYAGKAEATAYEHFINLSDSYLSADTFSFYISVSAVFSSRIEGEDIELDSFIKHKLTGTKFSPDHTQKIDDLYEAYRFAERNELTPENVESVHSLLTKHILQAEQQGKHRTGNMFVTTHDGRIEYVACEPRYVKTELNKFYNDLRLLLSSDLKFEEVLFFASLIHLVFVKIHPFYDGNGRTARLLEKWFMAIKLGEKAWFVRSEQYYYNQHDTYYRNIRLLGLEYDLLNYSMAMQFLLMLPQAIQQNNQ